VRSAALLAAFAAFPLALALRVHNALAFPPDWGFDAAFNWQYIEALRRVWHLPAPDAGWSTSDPPLYFALAALLMRIAPAPALVPWLNLALGLLVAACAAWLVRRLAPGDTARAALAAGLVLYLPAHVQMSAMVNEEMLASAFTALAIALAADPARAREAAGPALRRALGAGAAAGLALLSKLSGALAIAACAAAWLYDARRSRAALARAALCCALAALVGGWFFARNRIVYGYFQPHDLAIHGQLMWDMPPGRRELADYLRFPLATFRDPQVLNPELLRSVWGTTYASLWFDAHRMFLPTHSEGVRRLGAATLLLALLPTAAFLCGAVGGARRCLRGEGDADAPLLALVALSLAGYAVYAWQNPWFAVLKGTSLLGLCVPYGVYASESLCRWSRRGRAQALAIGALLAALAVCVVAGTAFQAVFVRTEYPGIPWRAPVSP
jgi:4-amino-4-deoxy-L-arabinose transferase-like glycosyltransferase